MQEQEYYSKLITELLVSNDDERIKEIIKTMEDIKSPLFLYPLYEAYKKHRYKSYSFFFISAMAEAESSMLKEVLVEVAQLNKHHRVDTIYLINVCEEKKFYDEVFLKLAFDEFEKFYRGQEADEFELNDIFSYITGAEQGERLNEKSYEMFLNIRLTNDVRKEAFNFWLKLSPSKHFDVLIDSYEEIKTWGEMEVFIAKTIVNWSGQKVDILSNLIYENGGEAKAIIEISRKRKKKSKDDEKKDIAKKREESNPNIELVQEIIGNRKKINSIFYNDLFGFKLLPSTESLILQSKKVDDISELAYSCLLMREIIRSFGEEIYDHGLDKQAIQTILPDVKEEDYSKSFNALYVFLRSNSVDIDNGLCGLRKLNKIYSKIAHPKENEKEILVALEKIQMKKMFQNEEYSELHTSLLGMYNKFLADFLDKLREYQEKTDK